MEIAKFTSANDKSIADFRALVKDIENDTPQAQTQAQTQEPAKDWKYKTPPPNKSILFLYDCKETKIVKDWVNVRILECTKALKYRVSRAFYGLQVVGDQAEFENQAILQMIERVNKEPDWAISDNSLIAYDAVQRTRSIWYRAKQANDKYWQFSLDEYTDTNQDITRLDRISSKMLDNWLVFGSIDGIGAKHDISQALAQLPERQALCFRLYKAWDIAPKELAERLSIPHNTVLSDIRKARKALKSILADYNHKQVKLACSACGSSDLTVQIIERKTKNGKIVERNKIWAKRTKANLTPRAMLRCQICQKQGKAKEFSSKIKSNPWQIGRAKGQGPITIVWDSLAFAVYENDTNAERQALVVDTSKRKLPDLPYIAPIEDTPTITNWPDWARPDSTPEEVYLSRIPEKYRPDYIWPLPIPRE